jgi:hypothetical protein
MAEPLQQASEWSAREKLFAIPRDERQETAESIALDWNKKFLAPLALPPGNARFEIFPRHREDEWDTLRMSYQVENMRITISQSASVFGIEAQLGGKNVSALRLNDVEDLAKKLFLGGQDIALRPTSQDRKSGVTEIPAQIDKISWAGSMHWQYSGTSVSFWFIKSDGRPSAMVKTFTDETNGRWFSR